MPSDTLTRWSLSLSFDALARDLERPLSTSERYAMQWQDVEAEPPGFVVINRYRESPHPRVTFAVSELGGGWGFICQLADLESSTK